MVGVLGAPIEQGNDWRRLQLFLFPLKTLTKKSFFDTQSIYSVLLSTFFSFTKASFTYSSEYTDFVRLTSCATSVQRPLGFVIKQDRDNSVIAGVDNEYTAVSPASLPEGRNGATFRRSSQGVWKGPLVEIDDQANYNCIFESDQVCYLFKSILGMMIYLGQMGHLGMSLDDGETWEECSIGGYGVCRLAGNLPDGTIVIENYVIRKKI